MTMYPPCRRFMLSPGLARRHKIQNEPILGIFSRIQHLISEIIKILQPEVLLTI